MHGVAALAICLEHVAENLDRRSFAKKPHIVRIQVGMVGRVDVSKRVEFSVLPAEIAVESAIPGEEPVHEQDVPNGTLSSEVVVELHDKPRSAVSPLPNNAISGPGRRD